MGLSPDGAPGKSLQEQLTMIWQIVRIPTTAIVAQTLTEDWLVEIEIVAAA